MKLKSTSVVLAILFVCSILNLAISLTPSNQRLNTSLNAQEADYQGARLLVAIPVTNDAKNIRLKAIFINRSEESFFFNTSAYFFYCGITIKTIDGKEVPYTTSGTHYFGYGDPGQSQQHVPLGKGQSRHWEYNLADAFQPLSAGKYLLTAKADIEVPTKSTPATEKTVALEITDLPFEVQ